MSLAKSTLGGSKIHICKKVYFDQLLDFLAFIIPSHLLCHILLFGCWIFLIPSRCQTARIQIRSDILSGLIWDQTVCKGYQQTANVTLAGKELNTKQLVDTTFWLKPWLKLISRSQHFSIWLKCWLQQILSQGKPWKPVVMVQAFNGKVSATEKYFSFFSW